MAEEARPPVAIRISRPYANEDEYLARELDLLTRTGIVLVGAHPRPQGVVLRFEVVLANGAPLIRGEGRVVGYREAAFEGTPGLSLRFTRLDTRSKALVDRATTLREARARPASMRPPAPSEPSVPALDMEATRAEAPLAKSGSRPPPPLPAAARGAKPSVPPPAPPAAAIVSPEPPPLPPGSSPLDLESTHAEVPRAKTRTIPPAPVAVIVGPKEHTADNVAPKPMREAPEGRDDLLERLRTRAKSMSAETIREILEKRQA